ncbi:glycosyltransferase family 2 protein [Chitinimonas sp. PSY-7]|uniref:glycosyltransferase n=1 Tax=Chitinimonas sp. PSY-7 TaxID=3459088 RepID=UPI00403FE883
MTQTTPDAAVRVAIVIPVLNQLAYTQGCLECLQPDIAAGVQVIVVNNGSTDGTAEWLASQPSISVISNPENLGCAPAWNQGVKLAGNADWIIVLNNDVLLPAGWLQALLQAAEKHRLDIVCPAMRERDQNYPFASYAQSFMHDLQDVLRLNAAHGVCFAVKRTVFDRIGSFDEAFRIGQFEDTDFFRRARIAGFRTGIVGACFIHHFGSVTQDALSDTNRNRPYEAENRAYFRKKWQLGWWKRRNEKMRQEMQQSWWRWHEQRRYGHTLHEKWGKDQLEFY